ncbi:uncharacterized protein NECHADRAFT_75134 [Fusarium vanettenii 77-13-4]|uniref:HIT-type domain-containing protein n=1 Tax=Fusarium vanettenii (strain ATCC MYA-4622 / CBS 123669 / FGSC 9596 / NRRL 45880 / 77-13-4) TaxID=660122 RepID=C7YHY8_FUSV7|nr:uncharacterized protein NECHADRAFT_75134 [Fusarium vanettenii 77-13-4]EEU47997.1 hypothetical protein NECHADRAFT_75134 [Fusarium vanettenii 77-13-4]
MSTTQEESDKAAQPTNETLVPDAGAQDAAEATASSDATPPKPSLCGVCNVNPPNEYTSFSLYQPLRVLTNLSCSVACNKTHRENHPPDPEPAPKPEQPQPQQQSSEPRQPFDPSNPFRALESSDKLRQLFQKYPHLPDQLLQIHAATLPPPETKSAIPASLLKGLPPRRETWNHDIGIQNGKEALRRARRADGEEGDAIREYSELILHLMNTDNAQADVGDILRQQLAQEDTKLIERLMAQEKR